MKMVLLCINFTHVIFFSHSYILQNKRTQVIFKGILAFTACGDGRGDWKTHLGPLQVSCLTLISCPCLLHPCLTSPIYLHGCTINSTVQSSTLQFIWTLITNQQVHMASSWFTDQTKDLMISFVDTRKNFACGIDYIYNILRHDLSKLWIIVLFLIAIFQ